jgi:hypothetical protein
MWMWGWVWGWWAGVGDRVVVMLARRWWRCGVWIPGHLGGG